MQFVRWVDMGEISEATLAELHKICFIPGATVPLPKSPLYSVFLSTLPIMFRSIFRLRYRGIGRIPRKGAVIIAANHTSHIDPFTIISGVRRRIHYLAKDGHFEKFATSIIMKTSGQIRTHRESGAADALSSASDVLSAGLAMGIFPEGTRSKKTEPPFLLPGKTGIARLSASYPDVPVVPIGLTGTREFMTPNKHKLPRLWRKVGISYGKPITWWEWLEKRTSVEDLQALAHKEDHEVKSSLSAMYREFTDEFMERIKGQGAP